MPSSGWRIWATDGVDAVRSSITTHVAKAARLATMTQNVSVEGGSIGNRVDRHGDGPRT
jgi:hypothetical protein